MSLIGKLGRVKCTYVELFSSKGEKVFSVQKKDAKDMPIVMAVGEAQKGYVPCKITPDGEAIIKKLLAKAGGQPLKMKKYTRIFEEGCWVKQSAVAGFEDSKSIPWWAIAAGALVIRKLLK